MSTEFQERVLDSLGKLTEKVNSMEVSLARLDKHVYRIDELEKKHEALEVRVKPVIEKLSTVTGIVTLTIIGGAVIGLILKVKQLFAGQ